MYIIIDDLFVHLKPFFESHSEQSLMNHDFDVATESKDNKQGNLLIAEGFLFYFSFLHY